MADKSEPMNDALAKLRGIGDQDLTSLSHSPAAQALFEEVVSVQHQETLEERQVPKRARRGRGPRRRARLVWAAAAAAVVVAAGIFGVTAALRDTPTAEAVSFSTSGSFIVAKIEDPYAAAQQLDAAFAAHGLDITLKLVPVSPSMVGAVVYMGTSDGASDIGILYSSSRKAPGGPLPIGLRIPADFKGQADIVLGRAARPDETYVSTGDAFAPGEALYKSDLKGMRVSEAVVRLQALGLTAEWRDERPASALAPSATPAPVPPPTSSPGPSASPAGDGSGAGATSSESVTVRPEDIPDNWVTGAVPIAEGRVLIFTSKEKPSTR